MTDKLKSLISEKILQTKQKQARNKKSKWKNKKISKPKIVRFVENDIIANDDLKKIATPVFKLVCNQCGYTCCDLGIAKEHMQESHHYIFRIPELNLLLSIV